MDSLSSQDLSKSVDQICTTLSMNNIVVPRIDKFKDIFDFISEFEMVTATLPDDTRTNLLVKAFPPGRYQAWYNKNLKDLISVKSPWSTIKQKLIQRYSDVEDRDRHLQRLQDMKFVDRGQEKLFEYVEDIILSFEKAFPKIEDDDSKIRYVKSRLPKEIQPDLRRINDYNNPTTLEQFMKAVREYDRLKVGESDRSSVTLDKLTSSEMVNILKEIAKGVKQEAEATRNTIAALRPQSPGTRSLHRYGNEQRYQREASPLQPSTSTYHMNQPRPISPFGSPRYQRDPSPRRQSVQQNYGNRDSYQQRSGYDAQYRYRSGSHERNGPTDYYEQRGQVRGRSPSSNHRPNYQDHMTGQQTSNLNRSNEHANTQDQSHVGAFSSELYYEKFGKPRTPCQHCGYMHWSRHCQNYLN